MLARAALSSSAMTCGVSFGRSSSLVEKGNYEKVPLGVPLNECSSIIITLLFRWYKSSVPLTCRYNNDDNVVAEFA